MKSGRCSSTRHTGRQVCRVASGILLRVGVDAACIYAVSCPDYFWDPSASVFRVRQAQAPSRGPPGTPKPPKPETPKPPKPLSPKPPKHPKPLSPKPRNPQSLKPENPKPSIPKAPTPPEAPAALPLARVSTWFLSHNELSPWLGVGRLGVSGCFGGFGEI